MPFYECVEHLYCLLSCHEEILASTFVIINNCIVEECEDYEYNRYLGAYNNIHEILPEQALFYNLCLENLDYSNEGINHG